MQTADSLLRVGVVGCGSFGRNTYARHVVDSPDATLIALCDTDRARAEATADEFSDNQPPAIYTDENQMLERESLDIVMVATMADVRPRISIAALNSGAHVLAAKPMAISLAEAEQMLEAAEQSARLLMVGYNFRFREDAQVVHRFIREGGLGTPLFARAWCHAAGVPVWGPHYIKLRSGGGALASTGIHTLDLAVWLLDSPPILEVTGHAQARYTALPTLPSELQAVENTYDAEDLVTGYARFANGATLSIESIWLAPPQINNNGVDIWGTHGFASLGPLRLLTWRDGGYIGQAEHLAPGLSDSFQDNPRPRTRREVRHFIDCVLGRETPLITPQEMWTDAAIMEGINETARYCISVYAFCVDDLKGVGDIAAFAVPHERLTEVVDLIRRDSIRIQFHLYSINTSLT
jgi:predicted dehydrogenase